MHGIHILRSDDLTNRYGFADGKAFIDYAEALHAQGKQIGHDDLLHAAVMDHLVPTIERITGCTLEIRRVPSVHNPSRLVAINGEAVSGPDDRIDGITVTITDTNLAELAKKIEVSALSGASATANVFSQGVEAWVGRVVTLRTLGGSEVGKLVHLDEQQAVLAGSVGLVWIPRAAIASVSCEEISDFERSALGA